MWTEIKKAIVELEALDKGRQLFGAESHQYRLMAAADGTLLSAFENELGVALPSELRTFYTEMGNGVVGPDYGLIRLEKITGYNPSLPYQGVEYLKDLADRDGCLFQDGYFEIVKEDLQGLVRVIDCGCGHEICLVTCGNNVGNVVYVSNDGFVEETGLTLIDLYKKWLKVSINAFKRVKELLGTDLSMDEIDKIGQQELKGYNPRDLAISLMGVEKPASLFGSGNHKIYHGASQFPWYEKQLQEYRKIRKNQN